LAFAVKLGIEIEVPVAERLVAQANTDPE